MHCAPVATVYILRFMPRAAGGQSVVVTPGGCPHAYGIIVNGRRPGGWSVNCGYRPGRPRSACPSCLRVWLLPVRRHPGGLAPPGSLPCRLRRAPSGPPCLRTRRSMKARQPARSRVARSADSTGGRRITAVPAGHTIESAHWARAALGRRRNHALMQRPASLARRTTIKGLLEAVHDGRLFSWVATTTARRWAGVVLALYAFGTDWLTGWHSMGFVTRGLLDWPAHLATALVILGALIRVRGALPDQRFGWAMLACSVLIDLDHLPLEFGSDILTNGTPRPYTHALWTVIVLTLAWATTRFFMTRSARPRPATAELILAGAASGVAAHFVRDIATAPMSFWWPLTDMAVQVPYWLYVLALAAIIAIGPIRRHSGRTGSATHETDDRDYEDSRLAR